MPVVSVCDGNFAIQTQDLISQTARKATHMLESDPRMWAINEEFTLHHPLKEIVKADAHPPHVSVGIFSLGLPSWWILGFNR